MVGCFELLAALRGMAAAELELVAMPADMAPGLAGVAAHQLRQVVQPVGLAYAQWRLGAELGWIAQCAASSPVLRCCYHQTYLRSAAPRSRHR